MQLCVRYGFTFTRTPTSKLLPWVKKKLSLGQFYKTCTKTKISKFPALYKFFVSFLNFSLKNSNCKSIYHLHNYANSLKTRQGPLFIDILIMNTSKKKSIFIMNPKETEFIKISVSLPGPTTPPSQYCSLRWVVAQDTQGQSSICLTDNQKMGNTSLLS